MSDAQQADGELSRLARGIHQLRADTVLLRLHLLLKAGFRPDQPRVPAGNADGGQWTDGGGTVSRVSSRGRAEVAVALVRAGRTPPWSRQRGWKSATRKCRPCCSKSGGLIQGGGRALRPMRPLKARFHQIWRRRAKRKLVSNDCVMLELA